MSIEDVVVRRRAEAITVQDLIVALTALGKPDAKVWADEDGFYVNPVSGVRVDGDGDVVIAVQP